MRKITFDIETKNFFHDIGSNDPADLDISIICIHDSSNDRYDSFTETELGRLWPILEQADMFITWNGDHFDIPILNKYYPGDLNKIKSLDLMKEVQRVLGRRLKLNTVAQATLGVNKSADGIDAVDWWRKGEIDKLIKYCMDDVKITKDIYDYAISNNKLKYKEMDVIKEIQLNTTLWEVPASSAMTFTLPF